VVASFHARGDTTTPMYVSLGAVAFNVMLKFALVGPFGVMGLALATALGATVNLALLLWLADAKGWMQPDGTFGRAVAVTAAASFVLAVIIVIWDPLLKGWLAPQRFALELRLAALGLLGGLAYVGTALFAMRLTGLKLRRGA
jgi:putative peptidoglycan lipid II flippase